MIIVPHSVCFVSNKHLSTYNYLLDPPKEARATIKKSSEW